MKRINKLLLPFSFLLGILLSIGCSSADQNQSKPPHSISNPLNLKLPNVKRQEAIETIYINNDSVVWNKEKIDFTILKSRFKKLKTNNENPTVILSSTRDTKIQRIVKTLELAQQNGIDLVLESRKNE